jgi:hypothetical protein
MHYKHGCPLALDVFLAGARLRAWPAGRKKRMPIMLHEDLILLYIPLPYIDNNSPARRSCMPECHFIHVYSFSARAFDIFLI